MTPPQILMLAALAELNPEGERARSGVSPRQLAKKRWPWSGAWKRCTHKHGNSSGTYGGTMPMKAATVLWRLRDAGMAYHSSDNSRQNRWYITTKGLNFLREYHELVTNLQKLEAVRRGAA